MSTAPPDPRHEPGVASVEPASYASAEEFAGPDEGLQLPTDEELDSFITPLSLKLTLLVASVVGLFAAATLVYEKIVYWTNEAKGVTTGLGCDINPIVGCGPVINTPPASIFGNLPNPVIGVAAWSAVGVIAVLLLSGVKLKTWHWLGLQVGVIGGLAMVSYLQFESIYRLHALCPYCMMTWAVMIPTFWAVTARNLRYFAPGKSALVYSWTLFWVLLHYIVLATLIYLQFGMSIFA